MRVTDRRVLLALPGLFLIGAVLFYPLLDLLRLSAASGTFQPYRDVLGDPLYLGVIGRSMGIAALTAAICLVLAYPVAYFLATASPAVRTAGFLLVMLPFWTSLLVRTYAWMILLGRGGVINRLLLDAGLVGQPLALMFNTTGVLIGTVHYLVPFMVLPVYAAMRRIDPNLLLAAEGLGARAIDVFLRVYLPLTLKGVFAGVSVVFIIALSAFVTPVLLGGGRVVMIANLIQLQVSQLLDWPLAGALSAIVLAATLLVYAGLGLAARRRHDTA